MANSSAIIFSLAFVAALTISVDASGGHGASWVPVRPRCEGSVAECMDDHDDVFGMDSEISRRILATSQYISYGALQRNTVPCSQRGASYYNCKPGAQSNPYNRGCSAIARCRS
ncbi:hypothetical protein ACFX13_008281 [Malus domestica]|uniref:Rapid alkalinization factor-like n=1 Tax=Malus domestica TaxID=3750 RepID=A0A498IQ48_MALDO|nr:hypothetical protein DVH24_027233 [Malus domestica]